MKTCFKCNEIKSLNEFYKSKRYSDGLFCYCKQCERTRRAIYVLNNSEKAKESSKLARINNPDRVAKNRTEWRQRNKEHCKDYRQKSHYLNLEENLLKARDWKKDNKDKVKSYDSKRRITEKRCMPLWACEKAINNIYRQAIDLSSSNIIYHVDHIVPLQSKFVCGLHCEANLQILTAKENQAKGNRVWPDMP